MSSIEQAERIEARESARATRVVAVDDAGVYAHERAPFALRCGALLIDYLLVTVVVAFSTLLARLFGSRTAADMTITVGLVAAAVIAALDLVVLPAFTGRTVGKWATGLRVERRDGERVGFGRALLRHTVGYLLSLLTLGLGFLLAAFSREGRALHDMVAGTVVVRE
ncbi:MAG: RDD family protein [Acidobacteria bacterium]|nr:RDD family protein [Acidobacteriota bacterium]